MKIFRTLNIIIFALVFGACNKGDGTVAVFNMNKIFAGYEKSASDLTLMPREYVAWVQNLDNGLHSEKTIDEINFSIQYKPYNYIICMEERSDSISSKLVASKVSELNGLDYYDLKIKLINSEGELLKHDLSSSSEYQKRVEYFAFGLEKDIRLVNGKDSIRCSMFHFERSYEAAPYCTILLGFKSLENNKNAQLTLVLEDKIFSKGIIKFTFNKSNFERIPKLKTI